jgi:nicotinamidase-related amidase
MTGAGGADRAHANYSEATATLRDLRGRLPDFKVDPDRLALLVIDMQYIDASPDYGYGANAKRQGTFDTMTYYFERLDKLVIPNIQRLLEFSRGAGIQVVYVRVGCRNEDGSDTSWRYKQFNLFAPPGSKEREILEELAPQPGDMIVEKTTSGVFNSTNLDQVLRNMGITSLIVTGVATNGCVETSTRGAGDLGYLTYLVDDATATYTQQLHDEAISDMDHNFALVKQTQEVIDELEAAGEAREAP